MDKKMFWWFFGTIATIIVVAFLFAMVAPAAHSLIFVAFLGLGGVAALGFAYYAYFSLKKDFQEAVAAAGVTIIQLEKRLISISPLHYVLAEIPKLGLKLHSEDGGGIGLQIINIAIVYSDLKNRLVVELGAYSRMKLVFEQKNNKVVAFTSYNTRLSSYPSCDKEVEGDIVEILKAGEGELFFYTGCELDENRKKVIIKFEKEKKEPSPEDNFEAHTS